MVMSAHSELIPYTNHSYHSLRRGAVVSRLSCYYSMYSELGMRHLLYGPIPKMCCFKIWSMLTSQNLGFESLVTLVSTVSMKLPVFTKDLFETFRIGVKKMAGSAFCTPKMLKKKKHHNSSTRRHHLALPVGLLLGLNLLNLCRIPWVKFPDRLAEDIMRHPHPLWFDESLMGAPKKKAHESPVGPHPSLFPSHLSLPGDKKARQDFQAGEKGRSKTAWNAESKQKWGCQLPPTHLNCELEKMVWSGGMNRAETAP